MNKLLRFLLASVGFYTAACVIVLQAVPGRLIKADPVAASSAGSSQSAASSSGSSAASGASAAPVKAVDAPHTQTFDVADISHHDVISDWAALKSATGGLYMKATEGSSYVDPMLDSYSKAAQGAGLAVGYFHYFWASAQTADAVTQAGYFYRAIHPYAYTFYPAVDVEEPLDHDQKQLTAAQITESVLAFCKEFERLSGHSLLIYCSRNFADKYLSDARLAKYGLWVADYNGREPTQAGAWKTHAMWQYTNRATLPGVPNPMDANHATAAIVLPGK